MDCIATCKTCSGINSNCLSCYDGRYLEGSNCVTICSVDVAIPVVNLCD